MKKIVLLLVIVFVLMTVSLDYYCDSYNYRSFAVSGEGIFCLQVDEVEGGTVYRYRPIFPKIEN